MRLSTDQLPQQLVRGVKPLYAVFGGEPLLALEAADAIRAAARAAGYGEREVLTAEPGFKWRELAMAAGAQSLFASQKLLELRIPSGKPGVEGAAALQAYCAALPADTVTLISLPELDWRTQKGGWFEALDHAGVTVEARPLARGALPQWLAARLKAQGQEADAETLAFMTERVEGNLLAAHQEVQKLGLALPPGRIGFDAVRDAVLDVTRHDVMSMGEVMVDGDPVRIARTLEGLQGEGAAVLLALWAVVEEIRAVGTLLDGSARGRPLNALWREARVWGTAHQEAMQRNLRRFNATQVENGLRRAAAIDRMAKGMKDGDAWDELLQLALSFARQPAAKPLPRTPPTSSRIPLKNR